MLNFSKPWIVASLLVATSVFGQDKCPSPPKPCQPKPEPCKPKCEPCKPCEPVCCKPHEMLPCPTIAAYNAPARIDTQCPWDVWVDASFIYWLPYQSNMNPTAELDHGISGSPTVGDFNFHIIDLDYDFKPGFKVGLGMAFDHDNWDASIEYTRLHGSQHRSHTGANQVYLTEWMDSVTSAAMGYRPDSFNAHWRLNMDFLDVDMGRWFYSGTRLLMRPSVGIRAAWIDQSRHATYFHTVNTSLVGTTHTKTDSWAIGPRAAIASNWLIGDGFRFYGNGSADILYTRYKMHSDNSAQTSATAVVSTVYKQNHINTLRTHLDLELGIGWGSYFDCNNWHFDLSAGYGFQVFFNQNMFPQTFGVANPLRITSVNGNLYVQGLTVTARLDF